MRLNINLATHPYEDVRQFLMRWGLLTLLFAVLSFGFLYYAVSSWRASSDINKQISRIDEQLTNLEKDRVTAIQKLNRPENKVVVDQSRFLNAAIQRRSLSWTRIFMDLERLMPPRLHVVSIKPELTKDNQLAINLEVAGDSRDRAIELVRRMEDSATFKRAELHSESVAVNPQDPADTVKFEITANYVESPEDQGAAAPAKSDKKPQTIAKSGGAR